MFRCYWIPALLTEELPENDCPPVRLKLLSERLIAFRDTDGRYGLMDEFCAHRGISLWFGRNEECGLRCPYHGWKYDVTGQCVDMPNEPEHSAFAKKVKLKSYPLVERGGVLWTYMGPPETQPPLLNTNSRRCPPRRPTRRSAGRSATGCRRWEGGIDSSHVSFLHRSDLHTDPLFKGARGNQYNLGDLRPVFEVVESTGGLYIGAAPQCGERQLLLAHHAVGDAVVHDDPAARESLGPRSSSGFPLTTRTAGRGVFDYHPTRALAEAELSAMRDGKGIHAKVAPGNHRPVANKDNDYLMDRAAQKAGRTYSGIEGFAMQDASLQESMGPIVDRSKETLVSTDSGIILARQRLLRAVKAFTEGGVVPPGVDLDHQRVRSAAVLLPPDQPFKDAARDALIAHPGVAPASV
jgi:nitrite reductase/ring-hydroxylating ferredoxin subunit